MTTLELHDRLRMTWLTRESWDYIYDRVLPHLAQNDTRPDDVVGYQQSELPVTFAFSA